MGNEERLLKVLAGVYIGLQQLPSTHQTGVSRNEINAAILQLGFRAHNQHQLGKDLEELLEKGLVQRHDEDNVALYGITDRGSKISEQMISIWQLLKQDD